MGHSIGGSRYSRKCCQFRLLGATVKYETGDTCHCPRCGCPFRFPGALSRSDNKTAICPPCGQGEAYEAFRHGEVSPIKPLITTVEKLYREIDEVEEREQAVRDEMDRIHDALQMQREAAKTDRKKLRMYEQRYAGMVEGLLEESKKKDALIEQLQQALAAQLTEKEPA